MATGAVVDEAPLQPPLERPAGSIAWLVRFPDRDVTVYAAGPNAGGGGELSIRPAWLACDGKWVEVGWSSWRLTSDVFDVAGHPAELTEGVALLWAPRLRVDGASVGRVTEDGALDFSDDGELEPRALGTTGGDMLSPG